MLSSVASCCRRRKHGAALCIAQASKSAFVQLPYTVFKVEVRSTGDAWHMTNSRLPLEGIGFHPEHLLMIMMMVRCLMSGTCRMVPHICRLVPHIYMPHGTAHVHAVMHCTKTCAVC